MKKENNILIVLQTSKKKIQEEQITRYMEHVLSLCKNPNRVTIKGLSPFFSTQVDVLHEKTQHRALLSASLNSIDYVIFLNPLQESIITPNWDTIIDQIHDYSSDVSICISPQRNQKSTIGSNFIYVPHYRTFQLFASFSKIQKNSIQKNLDKVVSLFLYLDNYVAWVLQSSITIKTIPKTPIYQTIKKPSLFLVLQKPYFFTYIIIRQYLTFSLPPKTLYTIIKNHMCIKETKYQQLYFLYPLPFVITFIKILGKKLKMIA